MFLHSRHFTRRVAIASATALLTGGAAAGAAWATTTAAAPAGPPTCTVSDLYVSMGRKEGAAGSLYWPIRFTNTGTSGCALRGYPGVSVLDAAHHQMGAAATRTGGAVSTVTLAPAHSASAVIRTTNGPVVGTCQATGTYLRVYPPASRTAVLVPAGWKVCSGTFRVAPVTR
ncbi:DUF4232 domain-containing protein [Streptomyces sp. NPDC001508]|uniref:DUF4232 domain-containing protein n=1 Tax=Streptomyces sp. NPDC001508 TaxID=3154656 RepID=UPI00332EDFCE